jgi:hypothetical protein
VNADKRILFSFDYRRSSVLIGGKYWICYFLAGFKFYTLTTWAEDTATLGSDRSFDLGPEWPKAVNPGSARAEPSHLKWNLS